MSKRKVNFQTGDLVEVVRNDLWCLGLFTAQGPDQGDSFYFREVPVMDLEQYKDPQLKKRINQIEGNLGLIVYVSKNRLNQPTGYGVLIKGKRMFCKYQLAQKYLKLVRTHNDESGRFSKV